VTVESGKARQQEMANLYNMLPVTEGAPYEFIASDWLVKWLSNDEVKPVDNSSIVCQHGKLNPSSVPQTKCISSIAVSALEVKKPEHLFLFFYFIIYIFFFLTVKTLFVGLHLLLFA
jgi:hypothetical protein